MGEGVVMDLATQNEHVDRVTRLVAHLQAARVESITSRQRVNVHKHFAHRSAGQHLVASWFAEEGRMYESRRGREIGSGVHEYVPQEVELSAAASGLLDAGFWPRET